MFPIHRDPNCTATAKHRSAVCPTAPAQPSCIPNLPLLPIHFVSDGQQYAPQPQPNLVAFPTYPYYPYPTPISQYNQQYAAQHMVQVVSSDDNRVFVSDGNSWKEYNLEKVSSW